MFSLIMFKILHSALSFVITCEFKSSTISNKAVIIHVGNVRLLGLKLNNSNDVF